MKPPVQLHVNNSYSRVTFQIKNGYHFELLTANSMKLLGITEEKDLKAKVMRIYHLEISLTGC